MLLRRIEFLFIFFLTTTSSKIQKDTCFIKWHYFSYAIRIFHLSKSRKIYKKNSKYLKILKKVLKFIKKLEPLLEWIYNVSDQSES